MEELDYIRQLRKLKSQTTKKNGDVAGYLLAFMKTVGVALVPALIGVIQRSAIKTMEGQKQTGSVPSTSFSQTVDPLPTGLSNAFGTQASSIAPF